MAFTIVMWYVAHMDIDWIRDKVASGQYLWTLHADEERRNDSLTISEVEIAFKSGIILEQYPTGPRGASCLVYGEVSGMHVHIVCGKNTMEQLVIITVYKPELPKWKSTTERG